MLSAEIKRTIAVACCDAHEDEYGPPIPPSLKNRYSEGKLLASDYYRSQKELSVFGEFRKAVELRPTPPSWTLQATLGRFDEDIVGPDGSWKQARNYLPLFEDAEGALLVVRLDDPLYRTAWFDRPSHREEVGRLYNTNLPLNQLLQCMHPIGQEELTEPFTRRDLWQEFYEAYQTG